MVRLPLQLPVREPSPPRGRPIVRGVAAASLAVALLSLGACGSCHKGADTTVDVPAGTSVVLISIDTLRADHLPVYGNRALRTALFFPVLVVKRMGTGVGPFVEQVGKRNKSKMTAVTAGMRKLAHIIYGVLSSGQPYNPELVMKSP